MNSASIQINKKSFIKKQQNIDKYYTFDSKPLGKGSYGIVRKGKHKITNQIRAIKTIMKSLIEDKEKFKLEIDILSSMDHPNIVKLFEWYEDEQNYYLVMEICQGGDLFIRIKQLGFFQEEDAKIIFNQIIKSIRYCHERKIVHRDLKPENFVFVSNDKNSPVKLIDFGLSKMYQNTKTGELVPLKTKAGSPYYIAPEVLTGNYNVICDIWSCGVILYIMLCGYPPFFGDTDNEVIDAVKKGDFMFEDEDWENVSQQGKELIKRMLTAQNKRINTDEVLNHPWFNSIKPKARNNNLEEIIKKMAQFKRATRLQKLTLNYMATQLNEAQLSKIKAAYYEIDENQDGKISYEEVYKAFESTYSREELQQITKSIDVDYSGFIDYTEFIAATMDETYFLNEDNLLNAFNAFDTDKSGKITGEKLKSICGEMSNSNMPDNVWTEIIKEADLDNDSQIDFNEFMKHIYNFK